MGFEIGDCTTRLSIGCARPCDLGARSANDPSDGPITASNEVGGLLGMKQCDGSVLHLAGLEHPQVNRRRVAHDGLVNAVAPMCEIERDAIRLALVETRGNRNEAARRLGISRATLYARLKRYALEGDAMPGGISEACSG